MVYEGSCTPESLKGRSWLLPSLETSCFAAIGNWKFKFQMKTRSLVNIKEAVITNRAREEKGFLVKRKLSGTASVGAGGFNPPPHFCQPVIFFSIYQAIYCL